MGQFVKMITRQIILVETVMKTNSVNDRSTPQVNHYREQIRVYVTAAGCRPVIPVSTSVWAGVSDRPVYMSGHYGDSVRDGSRILLILWAGTH